jgi:hypothetical protein
MCVVQYYDCHKFGNTQPLFLINPLNTKLNPICNLLALLGAHHILHVSRIRVNAWMRTTARKIKILNF